MQCKYRVVLSIDGGGIRGILPLAILSHLQHGFRQIDADLDLPNWIDVFSGTSTGAIIAASLMLKDRKGKSIHTPESVLDLYKFRGKQIFNKTIEKSAHHKAYPLERVLELNFQDRVIDDINKHFLFLSYDMNANEPFYFKDTMPRMRDLPMYKMLMACCAVPGLFPPVKVGRLDLADGMLSAKNPSQLALNYAKMFYPEDPIVLISLGTGALPEEHHDSIERQMMQVEQELNDRKQFDHKLLYFRFQPKLNHGNPDIDDTSNENIQALLTDAKDFIQENQNRFDRLFSLMRIKAELA
jgi:uncharacterized protein